MLISTKHRHVLTTFVIDEASCHDFNGKTITTKSLTMICIDANPKWTTPTKTNSKKVWRKSEKGFFSRCCCLKIKSPMTTYSSYHFRKGPIRFSMLKNLMHCLKLTNIPMNPLNKLCKRRLSHLLWFFTRVQQKNERTEQTERETNIMKCFLSVITHNEEQ